MPNQVIIENGDGRLTVSWGKKDESPDPTIGLTSWRAKRNPDGTLDQWEPVGTAWALDAQSAGYLSRTLARANRQAYGADTLGFPFGTETGDVKQ
jgi:hypothetical protein